MHHLGTSRLTWASLEADMKNTTVHMNEVRKESKVPEKKHNKAR